MIRSPSPTAARRPSALRRLLLGAAVAAGGAAICLAVLPAAARAAGGPGDWPRWRGPNFDDKSPETGLLKEWPKGGPTLLWTATGLGGGYSSVSAAGGKLFTMGESADGTFVRGLDAAGKVLWSTKVGKAGGNYPGPRCTPTFDDDLLYAVGQFGDVVCLQAATGAEVWRKNLAGDFGGKMHSGWGFAESPLVDGDRVVLTPGGKKGTLLALNKKTGAPLWRTTDWTDDAAYTGAVVGTLAGRRQYVQLTADSVAGVDPDTGKLLWRADRPGKTAVIPTPIVADDHVFVTSGYGIGCDLFKITAEGAGGAGATFKAARVYSNKNLVNHHGGVVLHEGKLYGYSDGKGWTCVDFKTGETVWKTKEELGKGTCSFADGMLYLRDERKGVGTIALIEASPAGYKEHGRFAPPTLSDQQQWPHLVVAGGRLYVRDQDNLFCYDVKGK
jgi:outer membrane protein assembly factor BamB